MTANTNTRLRLRTRPDLKDRITELYAEGWTYLQIGDGVGLNRNQIAGIVSRLKNSGDITEGREGKPVVIKPRPAPKPKAPIESVVGFAKGSPLLSLHEGQCRFPVYTKGSSHLFCGNATTGTSSYCECHRGICWVKPKMSIKKHGIRA